MGVHIEDVDLMYHSKGWDVSISDVLLQKMPSWGVLGSGHDMSPNDYRFVYVGQKFTITPYHTDVLRSFSWSVNICGEKEWIFHPARYYSVLEDKEDIEEVEKAYPGNYLGR